MFLDKFPLSSTLGGTATSGTPYYGHGSEGVELVVFVGGDGDGGRGLGRGFAGEDKA